MVKIAISFYEYQEVRDVTSVKLKKKTNAAVPIVWGPCAFL